MKGVNWKSVVFWSLLFFLIYTWPTEGQEQVKEVTLTTIPDETQRCESPCTAKVTVILAKHSKNRWLVLQWENIDEIPSPGRAPRREQKVAQLDHESEGEFRFPIRDLPRGHHFFVATVFRGTLEPVQAEGSVYVGVDPPK